MDPVNRYGIKVEHDTATAGNSKIGIHEHDFYELYYLISGKRRYLINHMVYDVSPGDIVFVPKNQLHRASSIENTGYDRYILYFSDRQIEKLYAFFGTDIINELMSSGCITLPETASNEIYKAMEHISRDIGTPGELTDVSVTHLLQDIILNSIRYGSKRQCLEGESADKIQMVARYITEHYSQEITLSMAAKKAGFEKTYFSKQFKHLTGFGFQDYLLQTRILAAAQMLTETKLSIGSIAESCGFSCGNYFGDVFRRYKGLSPSEYRRCYQSLPLFQPKK